MEQAVAALDALQVLTGIQPEIQDLIISATAPAALRHLPRIVNTIFRILANRMLQAIEQHDYSDWVCLTETLS